MLMMSNHENSSDLHLRMSCKMATSLKLTILGNETGLWFPLIYNVFEIIVPKYAQYAH